VRVCMFHPVNHPMERGWVGRIDGEQVIHLAAQTLQSFFTGGGSAREHDVYPLADVCLLAPVLHPPAVRVFDDQTVFAFANPAAIVGPRAEVRAPGAPLELRPRLAALVGAADEIAGYTLFADWRLPAAPPPKDRDFALGLGPLLVTPEALRPDGLEVVVRVDGDVRACGRFEGFDWASACDLAAAGTTLRPGDLIAGPAPEVVAVIAPGGRAEIEAEGIGVLVQSVAG
jgi:Fumarylacetoacetate (FAA) hydrolase family